MHVTNEAAYYLSSIKDDVWYCMDVWYGMVLVNFICDTKYKSSYI